MLIGVISDSHDHIPHTRRAVQLFRERNVEQVIHAGDFCSPFMVPLFEGVRLKAVFGNNDGDRYLLMRKFDEINAELKGDFFELDVEGRKIAVYHGTYPAITRALRSCGNYDIVISGHTHEMVNKKHNGTLALNPGSAHGFDGSATAVILDTAEMNVEFLDLN